MKRNSSNILLLIVAAIIFIVIIILIGALTVPSFVNVINNKKDKTEEIENEFEEVLEIPQLDNNQELEQKIQLPETEPEQESFSSEEPELSITNTPNVQATEEDFATYWTKVGSDAAPIICDKDIITPGNNTLTFVYNSPQIRGFVCLYCNNQYLTEFNYDFSNDKYVVTIDFDPASIKPEDNGMYYFYAGDTAITSVFKKSNGLPYSGLCTLPLMR